VAISTCMIYFYVASPWRNRASEIDYSFAILANCPALVATLAKKAIMTSIRFPCTFVFIPRHIERHLQAIQEIPGIMGWKYAYFRELQTTQAANPIIIRDQIIGFGELPCLDIFSCRHRGEAVREHFIFLSPAPCDMPHPNFFF
jgi:hypothetical protein